MLTLRIIPPRLLFRRTRQPRDLTGLYFDALWRRWSAADRAAATALAVAEAGRTLASFRTAAWTNGWSRAEEALNHGAEDRKAHLGMAARKGLNRIVNPAAYPLQDNPLKNKRLFASRCRTYGLSIPHDFSGPSLQAWLSGEQAVIAKPNFASKGSGIAGYRRSETGWISAGESLTEARVLDRIGALLRRGGVLQRACATHPALETLSPGALPTLRVMTAVDENGGIEACGRVLRLSGGGPRAVDNFNAGNIVAGIDASGRAEAGFRRAGGALERLERHPTTDVAIAGAPVPDLEAAEALALRAHAAFREGFSVVGWDVGLTAGGPVLIEGNWNPGTDILQLVSGLGVGDTRLGALYRHSIGETPDAAWRNARPIQREPRRGPARSRPNCGVRPIVETRPAD